MNFNYEFVEDLIDPDESKTGMRSKLCNWFKSLFRGIRREEEGTLEEDGGECVKLRVRDSVRHVMGAAPLVDRRIHNIVETKWNGPSITSL